MTLLTSQNSLIKDILIFKVLIKSAAFNIFPAVNVFDNFPFL